MKISNILLATVVISFLISCSSVRTSVEYDKTTNFSKYKTFNIWKKGIDNLPISNNDKLRVVKHVHNELTNLGFTKAENPELLVNLIATGEKRLDIDTYDHFYWGYWWGGPLFVREYNEGSLYIELIDKNEKKLIWRGKGVSYFGKDIKDREGKIAEVVQAILKKYPVAK